MRLRRWLSSYGDVALAVALAAALLGELAAAGQIPARAEVAPLAVLASGAVAYRRRLPLASFVVLWSALLSLGILVDGLADWSVTFLVLFFVSLYSSGAHIRGLAAWVGGLLVTTGIVLFVATDGDPFAAGDVLFGAALVGGPWAAGLALRLRRDRERELTVRTAELETSRAELTRVAVADERRRIARELHDVVSHAISVTVLQARGGRRMLDVEPAEARTAFSVIEHTNAQALSDMRRLLALLRESDEDGDADPLPSLDGLEGLVAGLRSSGLAVALDVSGDVGGTPPGIGLSAYRIVQEALTNVLRHGAGAPAHVTVDCDGRGVEVVVTNADAGAPATESETGHGLIGMRERVSVAGGELEAGPAADGGFRVRAFLPYEVPA